MPLLDLNLNYGSVKNIYMRINVDRAEGYSLTLEFRWSDYKSSDLFQLSKFILYFASYADLFEDPYGMDHTIVLFEVLSPRK